MFILIHLVPRFDLSRHHRKRGIKNEQEESKSILAPARIASFSAMKILRIIARLNVGGPARHVVWLTKGLQDGEFQSTLIAGRVPDGEEDMGYLAGQNGIQPVFIDEMSRELSIRDAVSLIKIYRQMKLEAPDIIHTHTAKAGTVGRIAAFFYRWLTWKSLAGKPRKVRVVHTFHGHVFHSYYGKLKTGIFIAIEKVLARFATDKIVVISPQQFKEIHSEVGVGKEEQFAIIRLGIDLESYSPSEAKRSQFRRELAAADSDLLVGFVGRLTEVKNVSLLLQVIELYNKVDDLPKVRFVIVGDGHLRAGLESEASKRRIENAIHFLGNRADVDNIYAGLDIVALTSLNEGTPLSLIEAMASRRAVISTSVGGVVDLLGETNETHDGFNVCERGVGVVPNSAEGFRNGLIYLVKNEKLRESIASRGGDFAASTYSKDRLVADIRKLYRDLVN